MSNKPKRVLTYGTFDLFHIGHLNILERARELGDELFVGVSTDHFNVRKGKANTISFEQRCRIVSALGVVTFAFPEDDWDQKTTDVGKYDIDIFVMGDDWVGKFDFLLPQCEVLYLPRTPDISSTSIKYMLNQAKLK